MAIPRKGSRPITVGGTEYRWYVRRKVSYWQHYAVWNGVNSGTTIAVEQAQTGGSVLVVTFPYAHPSIYLRRDLSSKLNKDLPIVPVVPSQVAQCIAQALEEGWQPTKAGKAFHMNVAG
ncbi:hypothetical protein EON83_26690 [bacterium]|nr:MAG: hypothetical protein EON83_26690 [bacterium]